MKTIKKETNTLLFAILFFTRIPIPVRLTFTEDEMAGSGKYLPLIGLLIGSISAAVYWLSVQILPSSIAILLSMIAAIFATGAFHEDGFADVCDGFGGGWDKQRILDIMKDSHIGAYGTIGIGLLLLSRYTALHEIDIRALPAIMIAGHVTSRWATVWFMYSHSYARAGENSKSDKVAKPLSLQSFVIASATTAAVLAFLPTYVLIAAASVPVTKIIFARYINKCIGGYTGDVLGATQQLTEVIFYICVLAAAALY